MLRAHRAQIVHVHLMLDDVRCFEERERGRSDRPAGALPAAAFHRSRRVQFHDPPDLILATDALSRDEVYATVSAALALSS